MLSDIFSKLNMEGKSDEGSGLITNPSESIKKANHEGLNYVGASRTHERYMHTARTQFKRRLEDSEPEQIKRRRLGLERHLQLQSDSKRQEKRLEDSEPEQVKCMRLGLEHHLQLRSDSKRQEKLKKQRHDNKKQEDKRRTRLQEQNRQVRISLRYEVSSGHPDDKYRRLEKVGRGGYGCVYHGDKICGGQDVAIKVIKLASPSSSHALSRRLVTELQFMKKYPHPSIAQYIESYLLENELWVIMEYIDGHSVGDLAYVRRFSTKQMATVCKAVLKVLVFLHSNRIMHRDIKGNNILISKRGDIKIIDLGLATIEEKGIYSKVGTTSYMAPEVVTGEQYNCSIDIWALGMTLVEMIIGKPPYDEEKDRSKRFTLIAKNVRPVIAGEDHLNANLKDFLNRCLEPDPQKRPSASELLRHRFLSITTSPLNMGQFVISAQKRIDLKKKKKEDSE